MAQDPSDRRVELAASLRHLRLASGLSGPKLAEHLPVTQATVSRIERGITKPSVAVVQMWARETGATEKDTARLMELAVGILAGENRPWQEQDLAERQAEVSELEAAAERVRVYDPSLVSGLLQIPTYAEAMFRALGRDEEATAEAVSGRIKRQSVLFLPGKRFVFILGEAALHWHPAGLDIREAQLRQLLDLGDRPNIEIGIQRWAVPAPALPMGFWLFDIPDEGTQGFVEYYAGEKILTQDETAPFDERFQALAAVADFGAAAVDLIEAALHS